MNFFCCFGLSFLCVFPIEKVIELKNNLIEIPFSINLLLDNEYTHVTMDSESHCKTISPPSESKIN